MAVPRRDLLNFLCIDCPFEDGRTCFAPTHTARRFWCSKVTNPQARDPAPRHPAIRSKSTVQQEEVKLAAGRSAREPEAKRNPKQTVPRCSCRGHRKAKRTKQKVEMGLQKVTGPKSRPGVTKQNKRRWQGKATTSNSSNYKIM